MKNGTKFEKLKSQPLEEGKMAEELERKSGTG